MRIAHVGWAKKNGQNFSYNLGCLAVIIRLCLTHTTLCDYDIKEKGLLFLLQNDFAERQSSESDCTSLCETQGDRDFANLVWVFRATVYAIKKRMDDGRRAGSCRKIIVDRDSLRDFHSIISLRSHFEMHNNNKPFSPLS